MKTTTLRPLADRVLVQRDDTPTTSGLITLAGQQPPPERGRVVAVGPGKRNKSGRIVPLSVEVGDRVIFGRYGGATIKSEIGPLLAMKEDEVLGVLEGEVLSDADAAAFAAQATAQPGPSGYTKFIDKVLVGELMA